MCLLSGKFFNKIIPGIFKSLLVGLCTVTVTVVLGFTVLAPLGGYLGNYLAVVFGFLGDKIGLYHCGSAGCLLALAGHVRYAPWPGAVHDAGADEPRL